MLNILGRSQRKNIRKAEGKTDTKLTQEEMELIVSRDGTTCVSVANFLWREI